MKSFKEYLKEHEDWPEDGDYNHWLYHQWLKELWWWQRIGIRPHNMPKDWRPGLDPWNPSKKKRIPQPKPKDPGPISVPHPGDRSRPGGPYAQIPNDGGGGQQSGA